MSKDNLLKEYDNNSDENIFTRLDSYRDYLSDTHITIQDRPKRRHGILFTTMNLTLLEEHNFLNILGIDYELTKDTISQFHQDIFRNMLNSEQVLPNPEILSNFFSKREWETVRLRDILYKRYDELLFLDIKIDMMLNKYLIITVDDITDSLEDKFILEDLVTDNRVLVKEVHHRVKNNIQILLSLISLQERFNKTEDVIIKQMKLSLSAMALLHTKLVADDITIVILKSIISEFEKKCNDLYAEEGISFKFECDEGIELVIDKANPILLVINELITLSIENHFDNVEDKEIFCKLKMVGDYIELIYKDNGINDKSDNEMLLLALISQTDGQSKETDSSNYEMRIIIPTGN